MSRNYSSDIASMVRRFLDDDDWRYKFDSDNGIFQFDLTLEGKLKEINYKIIINNYSYNVYGYCPMNADEGCRTQMSEFVLRANYGLKNGNFELYVRDGELRYKTFVDCDESRIGNETIKNSIYTVARMFIKYEPGILAVLFGLKSAEQAVEECEKE